MTQLLRGLVLLLAVGLLAPALAQDPKKDEKKDEKPANAGLVNAGTVAGTVAWVDEAKRVVKVRVPGPKVQDPAVAKSIAEAQAKYKDALKQKNVQVAQAT